MKSANHQKNLAKLQPFVSRFVSFPFDDEAAEVYGRIRADLEKLGTPIGPNDLMITLTVEMQLPRVQHIVVTDDTLTVDLSDGRSISVPLAWYPRLLHGKAEEHNN